MVPDDQREPCRLQQFAARHLHAPPAHLYRQQQVERGDAVQDYHPRTLVQHLVGMDDIPYYNK